ncbi:MAG: hypothetical protein KC502_08000 [Myxococcales bacterium]|nr:hypothetical protein [Myxococcales bacterium]
MRAISSQKIGAALNFRAKAFHPLLVALILQSNSGAIPFQLDNTGF